MSGIVVSSKKGRFFDQNMAYINEDERSTSV